MKDKTEVEKAAWSWADGNVNAFGVNGFLAGAKWAEEKGKDDPKAELLELIKSNVDFDLTLYHPDIEHVKEVGDYLHCYVPPANNTWYWAVVDAIKEFCDRAVVDAIKEFCDRDKDGRYPVGGKDSIVGHLSVHFK